MTHTQATLILALLAIIAFSAASFLVEDWYYSFRAWKQNRAIKQERLDREYQAQLDWERSIREQTPPQPAKQPEPLLGRLVHAQSYEEFSRIREGLHREFPNDKPVCAVCGQRACVELNGEPRCDSHSVSPNKRKVTE